MMIAEFTVVFYAILNLLINILLFENRRLEEEHKDEEFKIYVMESVGFITTILMVLSLYIRYDLWLKWSQSINKLSQYDTLKNTGEWKNLLLEIVICCVIAPHHFLGSWRYFEYNADWDFKIYYHVNDILLAFSFIRTYLLIKFLLYTTDFMNPRSQRVCGANGCDASAVFAVKCIAQQKPFFTLSISLVITTFIFGY